VRHPRASARGGCVKPVFAQQRTST
jgi:hypothetical protein